jgi:hypothetical protein
MTESLRPMNLGGILDRTLRIYRSRFPAFVGLALIPVLAAELIEFADKTWPHLSSLAHPVGRFENFLWNTVVSLCFYNVFCVIGDTIEPGIVKLASSSTLGEDCSMISSLRFIALRWRSYVWIAVLKVCVVLVIPELVYVALLIGAVSLGEAVRPSGQQPQLVTPLLSLLADGVGVGLFFWLGACQSLSIPAAALENITGLGSIRRSWSLSKGTRLRIWFVWIVLWAATWVLAWVLEYLLSQLMLLAGNMLHLADLMRSLYGPAVLILVTGIYAVLGPILPIALTLFYYDQRIRNEGFDIERMMESAGLNTAETLHAQASEATTPQAG